jgi:hypothetical protein
VTPFTSVRCSSLAVKLESVHVRFPAKSTNRIESWSRKFGQRDRWGFCLMAGTLCPSNQERL